MCPNVYEAVFALADAITSNKEMLTDLDAAIGDADHGINMSRGFDAVRTKLAKPEDEDISAVLKKVGMTLISTVGGASGPLYGTAFLKAAGVVQGCEMINGEKAAEMLSAAVEGIKLRGKAQMGDKTMLDALEPAVEAISAGAREGRPLIECLEAACAAAEKGMLHTRDIKAMKGRASYLGDRSIGHQDPGATSSVIMMKALTEYYRASMQGI